MNLADKIIILRKRMGWSQEQLADCLNISRQSVSKWESGASVPELDKIIKMSELFGVSTDYLLKENEAFYEEEEGYKNKAFDAASENAAQNTSNKQEQEREVSSKEAITFINLAQEVSSKIALGVSLCILSPVCLLFLEALAEYRSLISEDMAGGIGLVILLMFVGAGVGLLILYGMKLDKYEFLEKENIKLSPETHRFISESKETFAPVYHKSIVAGVLLCMCSVSPLFIASGFDVEDFIYGGLVCVLLVIVAAGVYCFVKYGIIEGGFDKLLEEGDYTRDKKSINKNMSAVANIYWCFIVAAYLAVSFITNQWKSTWIIFPVAGVLFASCLGVLRLRAAHTR